MNVSAAPTPVATDALQDVHTATNDVLAGYREMASRAQPDVQPVIGQLIALHQRHADAQAALLSRSPEGAVGDTSLQGTVNKAVVVVRDWFTDIDRDTLPAVRKGEQALRDTCADALRDAQLLPDDAVAMLLRTQLAELDRAILGLPQH